MLSMKTAPNPIAPSSTEHTVPVLTTRAKDFITTRLARGDRREQIAAGLRAYFDIEIDPAQVIPFWKGELKPPTQTGPGPEKESVQLAGEAMTDRPAPPMPRADPPDPPAEATPANLQARTDRAQSTAGENDRDTPPTRTGPRPEKETQTGPKQEKASMPTLTDEIKEFIVKGLACYDTPSHVAEAVKATFDVEVTRQHVYAYDPKASQKLAPRWKELHAATREKFLREVAEIGVTHKAVRLRMLDRLAHRCERNSVRTALACLQQAAKECGGIYEKKAVASEAVPSAQRREDQRRADQRPQ